jgi:mRNA interferase HigB
MRIITRKRLIAFGVVHADARKPLMDWARHVSASHWTSLDDVRRVFPHADEVKVASGNTATIFNIKGNRYRLITAIHYNAARIFVMRFLTHAEYSKGTWKDIL